MMLFRSMVTMSCGRRYASSNVSRACKDVLRSGETLFINNEYRKASNGAEVETVSPHDERLLALLSDGTPKDADRAVDAARRSFETFRDVCAEERSEMLRNVASLIDEHVNEIAELESLDCGKPISESIADVETCRDLFRFYADLIPVQDKLLPNEEDGMQSRIVYEPKGVVAMVCILSFFLCFHTHVHIRVHTYTHTHTGHAMELSPHASLCQGRTCCCSGMYNGFETLTLGFLDVLSFGYCF